LEKCGLLGDAGTNSDGVSNVAPVVCRSSPSRFVVVESITLKDYAMFKVKYRQTNAPEFGRIIEKRAAQERSCPIC